MEAVASDASVPVPGDLKASLEALAGAAEAAGILEKGPGLTGGDEGQSAAGGEAWRSEAGRETGRLSGPRKAGRSEAGRETGRLSGPRKAGRSTASWEAGQGEASPEAGRRAVRLRWAAAAAAAAAVALTVTLSVPSRPKDTFSDPLLAYAEVQKTFDRISSRGEQAMEIAGKAVPVMEKTDEIIKKATK